MFDSLVSLERDISEWNESRVGSFMLETHSETGTYRCFAALIAHPLQRGTQEELKWVMPTSERSEQFDLVAIPAPRPQVQHQVGAAHPAVYPMGARRGER